MVKVLEKRIEEESHDSNHLWRVVLGATAEILGTTPVVLNLDDYFRWGKELELIPSDTRIVGIRPADVIYVDSYHSRKEKLRQGINVYPIAHYLWVYDPAHFNLARQLAEAYERRLEEGPGREFTLQKEYQE